MQNCGLESCRTRWVLVWAWFWVLAWKGRGSAFAWKWGDIPSWCSNLKVTFFSALLALNILHVWSHEHELPQINTLPKTGSEYIMSLFNSQSYCLEGSKDRIWLIVWGASRTVVTSVSEDQVRRYLLHSMDKVIVLLFLLWARISLSCDFRWW